MKFKILILSVVFPLAAVWAGGPLFVGISESFPPGDKKAKVTVSADYADAVSRSGHIPVVIPRFGTEAQFDALVAKLDVLIMTGGEDFDPSLYKAAKSPKLGTVNAPRDAFDFRLLNAARRRRLPVIGICRGCQLLNIAFGGTLWQDLPSEFPVANVQHRNVYHKISVSPDSRIARVIGRTDVLVAKAPDGVIEAVECDSYPAIGVQFHPEKMLCGEKDATFAAFFREMLSLFVKN